MPASNSDLITDAAANERNDFMSRRQELKFKLHELEQQRILIWMQTANFIIVTIIVIFLVLYFRPEGLADYFANWTSPFSTLRSLRANFSQTTDTKMTDSTAASSAPSSSNGKTPDSANSATMLTLTPATNNRTLTIRKNKKA